MKKYFTLMMWVLMFMSLPAIFANKGYSEDNIYEASLTVADSSVYNKDLFQGSISIKSNGIFKLSIMDLQHLDTSEFANKTCNLVIEAEVNDTPTVFDISFEVSSGNAEVSEELGGLTVNDKLEIISVLVSVIDPLTVTPTPTPTTTPSPTPETTATPETSPTPEQTSIASHGDSDNVILVTGGIITESTSATPTPTPVSSPTLKPSPTSTPIDVIMATVTINPKTINLDSNGTFKATIILTGPYDGNDVLINTVECEGAIAIGGKVDGKGRLNVHFWVQELELDGERTGRKELTVTGELTDGIIFEGNDTVRVKERKKKDDDDDDDKDKRRKK
ncbi:MAG: hypothetical protein MRJ65_13730 [Candidatus Brocadiaceae bacterium]|nr:hypothetical protein [Candidatus Brocadiaceae bacterium]